MSKHRAQARRGDVIAGWVVIVGALVLLGLLIWPPVRAPRIVVPTAPAVTVPASPVYPTAVMMPPVTRTAPPLQALARRTYTVRPGDNLTVIAGRVDEPLPVLEAENAAALHGHPDLVRPGLVLVLG